MLLFTGNLSLIIVPHVLWQNKNQNNIIMQNQINVSAETLHKQVVNIFTTCGTSRDYANTAADVMVDTDLRGIKSHDTDTLLFLS